MASFNLFVSNRMEVLAEKLANTLRNPLSDPMHSNLVIVQNRGMERLISMQLALRHVVCANVRFPFPRAFLYETVAKMMGIAPGTNMNRRF